MKRLSSRIGGIACLVLLVLPLAVSPWLAGTNQVFIESNEKRRSAPWPAPRSAGEWLSVDSYRALSLALQDRVPGRTASIVLRRTAERDLFFEKHFGGVDLGPHGWLDIRESYFRPLKTPARVNGVLALADYAQQRHRHRADLRLVVVPDKDVIYPEMLGPVAGRLAAAFAWRRRLVQEFFRDRLEGSRLGLWPEYQAAKAHATEWLYYPTDTHHTPAGYLNMVRTVVESLHPGIWRPSEVVDGGVYPKIGDLSLRAGFIPRQDRLHLLQVVRPGVTLERTERLEPARQTWDSPVRFHARSTNEPLISGKTLFLHDSHVEIARQSLQPFFEDITFRHYNDVIASGDLGRMLDEYDRVIVEVGERLVVDVYESLFAPLVTARLLELCDTPQALVADGATVRLRPEAGGVSVDARDGDPQILLPPVRVVPEGPCIVGLRMTSPVATQAQLFYLTPAAPTYTEENSQRHDVKPGENHFYFYLDSYSAGRRLRLDPGYLPARYQIESLEFRSLPRVQASPAAARASITMPTPGTADTLALGMMVASFDARRIPDLQPNSQTVLSAAPEDGILATARGDDPFFVLPRLTVVPGRYLMHVEIDSPSATEWQLFFGREVAPAYREEDSERRALLPGSNLLEFLLTDGQLRAPLRFDFASRPGTYLIRRLEIHRVLDGD